MRHLVELGRQGRIDLIDHLGEFDIFDRLGLLFDEDRIARGLMAAERGRDDQRQRAGHNGVALPPAELTTLFIIPLRLITVDPRAVSTQLV